MAGGMTDGSAISMIADVVGDGDGGAWVRGAEDGF